MGINDFERKNEEKYLDSTIKTIRNKVSSMGSDLIQSNEKATEFKKYMWDNQSDLDPTEMKSLMVSSNQEAYNLQMKAEYFKVLFKIQNNPYFGSIVFHDNLGNKENIYIGITHLENDSDIQLIYDWRSPICSLFYDYELGKCSYESPGGILTGELLRKRQYNISNAKLNAIFDTSVNIDDEVLQNVLSQESSDKMKNIVNTIQQEQNRIIRNIEDRNLFVQGIAGSGKTSVALHRIAFLLYKIKNLKSDNILIFSPNQIFTEYISNVLPELGENNTLQTTFNDFLNKKIKEFKNVESFVDFIARYYKYEEPNKELVKYKQSDEIINDLNEYLELLVKNTKFKHDICLDKVYDYSSNELNNLLHYKYNRYPLFERLDEIATKLSYDNNRGKKNKVLSYTKVLKDNLNLPKDYKKIFCEFFKSKYSKVNMNDKELKEFNLSKCIKYEDALIFLYIKGYLEGFPYDNTMQQIVVDEAQDYSKLQYLLLTKIFKKASYTILGDINQTINPYYKYDSMETLKSIFEGKSKYLELTKTYRSSEEIIEYTNKILDLKYISAIRKENNKPVILRKEENLKEQLLKDIEYLNSFYKSIAIITKDDVEASKIYNLLNKNINIKLVNNNTNEFKKELIIIPSYIAKGLEFDSVIVYNELGNNYTDDEKHLCYVACTRAQHEMIVYNGKDI